MSQSKRLMFETGIEQPTAFQMMKAIVLDDPRAKREINAIMKRKLKVEEEDKEGKAKRAAAEKTRTKEKVVKSKSKSKSKSQGKP